MLSRERHWGGALAHAAATSCKSHDNSYSERSIGDASSVSWADTLKALGGAGLVYGSLFFNRRNFRLQDFVASWTLSDFALRPCVHPFDGVAELAAGLRSLTDPKNVAKVQACMHLHRLQQIDAATTAMQAVLAKLWPSGNGRSTADDNARGVFYDEQRAASSMDSMGHNIVTKV